MELRPVLGCSLVAALTADDQASAGYLYRDVLLDVQALDRQCDAVIRSSDARVLSLTPNPLSTTDVSERTPFTGRRRSPAGTRDQRSDHCRWH